MSEYVFKIPNKDDTMVICNKNRAGILTIIENLKTFVKNKIKKPKFAYNFNNILSNEEKFKLLLILEYVKNENTIPNINQFKKIKEDYCKFLNENNFDDLEGQCQNDISQIDEQYNFLIQTDDFLKDIIYVCVKYFIENNNVPEFITLCNEYNEYKKYEQQNGGLYKIRKRKQTVKKRSKRKTRRPRNKGIMKRKSKKNH